jgi:hypothetical protein
VRVRVRLGGAVLCLTAVAGLMAACGGSASTSNSANSQPGFQAYLTCLSQNGVTLPQNSFSPGTRRTDRSPGAFPSGRPSTRPSGGSGRGFGNFGDQPPTGVDPATWAKAQAACASLRPTGGPGGGQGGFGNNSAFTAYRNCLADHGVSASADPRQLNSADPTTAQAMKLCAPLRPSARPRPSASG